ncbi:MAG: hypothetical protein RL097_691, partial [Candidatus Parcubacteria bacterium]
MNETEVYVDLLAVFRSAQGKGVSELSCAVSGCNIPEQLKLAVCAAIGGDNRPLNKWLFTDGFVYGHCVAWIVPIYSDVPRYIWMLGKQNLTSILVQGWFKKIRSALSTDPLLGQEQITPSLLFVDTFEVSAVSVGEFRYEDEFAVFQAGYKNTPVEVSDLEQKMVINTAYALQKRQEALARMKILGWVDNDLIDCLDNDLETFAIIHNEVHNQGHFVGAWPFEEGIKKKCLLYEAVEEFRACLATIVMVEHLPLTDVQKDNYALSVFMSRFLSFGYEAFCLKTQRRETAREITVGLMFFEWLIRKGVISLDELGNKSINAAQVRSALLEAYMLIFTQESGLSRYSQDGLKVVAKFWYQLAFPRGAYSQKAKIVYYLIGEVSAKAR